MMTTKEYRDKILATNRLPQEMTIPEAAEAILIIREELYNNKLRATPLQMSQITDIAWALSNPAARVKWEKDANVAVDKMVSDWDAAAMGRKGGAVKSKSKTIASRENGRKGGRPRRNRLMMAKQ